MTRLEHSWALAILPAFAGGHEGLVPQRDEVDWLGAFETVRLGGNRLARLGMRLALWMAALSPLWLLRRLRTMRGLPGPERTALLGRLLSHRRFLVRELALLLKVAASMALLGAASVRARSGYDRPMPAAVERRTA